MKYALAFVLLGIPTLLSAGERCAKSHSEFSEIARSPSVKPMAIRAEANRPRKVIALSAWQRAFLFDPQIL